MNVGRCESSWAILINVAMNNIIFLNVLVPTIMVSFHIVVAVGVSYGGVSYGSNYIKGP